MDAAPTLFASLIIGVAYAALPGVVNTEAFRRGLRSGFRPAVSIQVGALIGDAVWAVVALIGDAVWAVVALIGATLLLNNDIIAISLSLVGAGFLFHLARVALLSAPRGNTLHTHRAAARGGGSLLTGVIFSIANPAGLAFWTGVGGGMLGSGGSLTFDRAATFLVTFIAGVLLWDVGMSALVAWGRRFASPRVFQVIDALSGLALGYFGFHLLWSTIQRFGRITALVPRVAL